MYPIYLYRPRISGKKWAGASYDKTFYVLTHYKGRQWIDDMEIYNLRRLYSRFENCAKIISFHGEADTLVSLKEKANFLADINNVSLYIVKEEDIDNKIFYNTEHGMGSNFLELFFFVLSAEDFKRIQTAGNSFETLWQSHAFTTKKYKYTLSGDLEIQRIPV